MSNELIFGVLGVSFFLLGMLAMWSVYSVKAAFLGLVREREELDPPPVEDDYPSGEHLLPLPDDTEVIHTGYYRHEEAA